MTNPAEPVLATTSIKVQLPPTRRWHGPEGPVIADSASDSVVVSRNGEVRLRGHSRIRLFLGRVHRDPENPKRWVAKNRHELPVGRKTTTRAEALDQLTDYIDHTVLEKVPVSEHVSVATGPVSVVPEPDPQPLRRLGQAAVPIVTGLVGLIPVALLLWGIPLMA